MKSRAVLASEVISRALMRVVALVAEGCGVKLTVRRQSAEGRMVVQLLWALWMVKSGVVCRPVMWMGTVPVLLRVTVWGWAASPTWVVAKGERALRGGVGDEGGGVVGSGDGGGGGGAGEFDEVGAGEDVAFDD